MQQVSNKTESPSEKPKFKSISKKFRTEHMTEKLKKPKIKKGERVIFGLIREDSANEVVVRNARESIEKKGGRRRKKDSCFNTGRWHPEEHQRFIEALLKYGNDWKNVQKHVGSRSSTQARSHAQKFFVKIGKMEIENLQLDFENNSLKSLNIMASRLNSEQLTRAIKSLNELAFDRKNSGRKNGKGSDKERYLGFEEEENFDNFELRCSFDSLDNLRNSTKSDCFVGKELYLESRRRSLKQRDYDHDYNYVFPLLKKKRRIRTIKKKRGVNFDDCEEGVKNSHYHHNNNSNLSSLNHIRGNFEVLESEDLILNKTLNRPANIGISNHPYNHTNRRNSIDFLWPTFNFINDNSIFISNSAFLNVSNKPVAEERDLKDFQLIFENSFKYQGNEFANGKTLEEADAKEYLFIGALEDRSPCSSDHMNYLNSTNTKDNITEMIEQFMDC